MELLIKLIRSRFSSQSPGLFLKLRNWSFIVGLIAATVMLLPFSLPTGLMTILTLLVGVCTGLSGGSSITTKDEKIIQETEVLFPTENKRDKFFSFRKRRKRKTEI